MGDRSLKRKWYTVKNAPHVPEWDNFESFASWCRDNDYTSKMALHRYDLTRPYGPRNCYLSNASAIEESRADAFIKKWNDTVNVIRKHYGLPLF